MSEIVIKSEGLSKKYTIGHQSDEKYTALRDVLTHQARSFMRSVGDMASGRALVAGDKREDFWALRDVNFEIKQGEVVGIIGRNGAGKSTLLKVLSRITEPTNGRVTIKGRVASLLEVGTGFHPELTGRENIYLNGAILGMSRAEIRRKFDEIVDFAGTEKFLDTPVKRYSSGMYVRLAFSVAAHLEPEILIVDEVLAVGDLSFQLKCLGKMQNVASSGRTVIFVSHSVPALRTLTKTCILLENGTPTFSGATAEALSIYLAKDGRPTDDWIDASKIKRRWTGTGEAKILSLKIEATRHGEKIVVNLRCKKFAELKSIRASFTIFSIDEQAIGSGFTNSIVQDDQGELMLLQCEIDSKDIVPGLYRISLAIGAGDNKIGHSDYDVVPPVIVFEIEAPPISSSDAFFWQPEWGALTFTSNLKKRENDCE